MINKMRLLLFPSRLHIAGTTALSLILGAAMTLGYLLHSSEGGGKLEVIPHISFDNLVYCNILCFLLYLMGHSG